MITGHLGRSSEYSTPTLMDEGVRELFGSESLTQARTGWYRRGFRVRLRRCRDPSQVMLFLHEMFDIHRVPPPKVLAYDAGYVVAILALLPSPCTHSLCTHTHSHTQTLRAYTQLWAIDGGAGCKPSKVHLSVTLREEGCVRGTPRSGGIGLPPCLALAVS